MSNAAIITPDGESSDASVVERVVRGETQAFALLVRRYNQQLFRTVRAILGNDADAEDALQQTYLSAYRHLASFEGRSKLSTWLTRIAIYEAFARRKRRSRVQACDFLWRPPDTPQTPDDAAVGRQLARVVEDAIDKLPEGYRLVFVLREVQGMSTTDVAGALDLSEENVRVRLHRGRDLLRQSLGQRIEFNEAYAFAGLRCALMLRAVMNRLAAESLPLGCNASSMGTLEDS
jgi:RNA polymerase sigma-70 factor (ECF subfamily)